MMTLIGLAIAFIAGLATVFVAALGIFSTILGVVLVSTGTVGADEWREGFWPLMTVGGVALVLLGVFFLVRQIRQIRREPRF